MMAEKLSSEAKDLYEEYIGEKVDIFYLLPQSGSSRKNFIGELNAVRHLVTENENVGENEAFLYFSNLFSRLNLNTPKINAVAENRKVYVQDFVGSETLSQIIAEDANASRIENLVKQSLAKLHHLQVKTIDEIDYSQTFEYEEYNRFPIWNDLFYFKNMFVDFLELPYHKRKLLGEFEKLLKIIEDLSPKTIMIRDFQARNIMVNNADEVFFIDYQSAMLGPALYDVVSFLYQAKANFSEAFKRKMLDFYISFWEEKTAQKNLNLSLEPLQLIRFLQVLGAYGFRGLIQRKPHFLSSIDLGIQNLINFVENAAIMAEFPELSRLILNFQNTSAINKIAAIK